MTHKDEILSLLIDRGIRGLNSFDPIRRRVLQLPFVIKTLKDEGYVISSIDRPDGSTTYVLQHVPPQLKDAVKAITRPVAMPPAPTLYCSKSVKEKKASIEAYLVKIQQLRDEYRAAGEEMRPVITRRARAIQNAIAKIDPAHPSLSSGRRLAR